MSNNLSISNVVNISVATPQQGLSAPNTANLALFTRESYASTFGTAGYKIYLSPSQVATDFGTGSNTYAMALEVFSVQPNILAANGYLVVIPFLGTAQDQQVLVGFPAQPASGDFYIGYNGNLTSALTYNESAASIQTALQSVSGLSSATVTGSISPSVGLSINSMVSGVGHPFFVYNQIVFTVSSANATQGATYTDAAGNVFTVEATISGQTTLTTAGLAKPSVASGTLTKASGTGDTTITYSAFTGLADSLGNLIFPTITIVVPGSTAETLDQAIIRTQPLVAYFGVMAAEIDTQIVTLAAAAYIQTQNLIGFFASYTSSDLLSGGMFYAIQQAGYTQSRCLFYDDALADSLTFMAAYATLLLSVNYGGSNTCLTMNLKSLSGVSPDPNITQTLVNEASTCGADVYPSIAGVPKVLSFGANDYSDNQVNLQAFSLALRTAYFNVLAQTNTKIPQTENGMNLIKGALQAVCNQFVTNGFLAPGTWTNPTSFGNQASLIQNVAQFGYYIYSSPIATQNPSARAARQAPLIQLACKFAGAEQTGTMIVYVNP